MNQLVVRTDAGAVATLTLNRPEKLNAMTKEMLAELDDHVDAIAREKKKIGLVILRGAGGNFSSGHDMGEVLDLVKARTKPHFHYESIERIASLPQPVVAAVQGHCSTGALELALAGDLIVAQESAVFSDVYARWGLTPIWGLSLRLPHRVGTVKAAEMMLTCRDYSGLEARAMHLVNYCFPDDRFESELARLCADVLANSWYSNEWNKRALAESDELPLRDAHALEIFKNEGLAPDAEKRVTGYLKRKRG